MGRSFQSAVVWRRPHYRSFGASPSMEAIEGSNVAAQGNKGRQMRSPNVVARRSFGSRERNWRVPTQPTRNNTMQDAKGCPRERPEIGKLKKRLESNPSQSRTPRDLQVRQRIDRNSTTAMTRYILARGACFGNGAGTAGCWATASSSRSGALGAIRGTRALAVCLPRSVRLHRPPASRKCGSMWVPAFYCR